MRSNMPALSRIAITLAVLGLSGVAAAEDAKPAPPPPAAAPANAQPVTGQSAGQSAGQPGGQPGAKSDGGWVQEVAPADGTSGIALDPHQTEIVKKVSNYFGTLDGLKGVFVQISADKKKMRGKFYVKRPGKFRFDYALPSRQIIVSDGKYLAIQDLDLNNEDRVSLDDTPFRLLLSKDVDLLRDARIFEVQETEDQIVLGLQDKNPDTPGKIKLVLSTKPELELKEWVTTDAQGLDTRVQVGSVEKTPELDAKLFVIQHLGARLSTPR